MTLKFLSRDNAKGIAFKAAAEPETATEATLEAAKALGFAPVHHKVSKMARTLGLGSGARISFSASSVRA